MGFTTTMVFTMHHEEDIEEERFQGAASKMAGTLLGDIGGKVKVDLKTVFEDDE